MKRLWFVWLSMLVLFLAACQPAATSSMDGDMDMAEGEAMEDTMTDESSDMTDETMDETTTEESSEMNDDAMMSGTIIDVAQEAGTFTTLLTALETAGLTETLMGEGPFTVFAPTDEAFAAFLSDSGMTAEDLLASPDLESILLYHVVAGEVPASDVMAMSSGTTVQGSDVVVTVMDGNVMLNATTTVVTPDIMASNGIIHVIDGVLTPPM